MVLIEKTLPLRTPRRLREPALNLLILKPKIYHRDAETQKKNIKIVVLSVATWQSHNPPLNPNRLPSNVSLRIAELRESTVQIY